MPIGEGELGPFRDGWTKSDVEAVIARGDPTELLYVPIMVSMDPPDRIWSQQICVKLSSHPNANVRANAMLGFGHLSRVFRYLNRAVVQPIIEAALTDDDAYVRCQAATAAGDIEWFAGWIFRGREERKFQGTCPPFRPYYSSD